VLSPTRAIRPASRGGGGQQGVDLTGALQAALDGVPGLGEPHSRSR
jgi:hypothetical protein